MTIYVASTRRFSVVIIIAVFFCATVIRLNFARDKSYKSGNRCNGKPSWNLLADIPAVCVCVYRVRKSLYGETSGKFPHSSLNVSDFYSVNPIERLDGIGIEVGRYGETHQSCRNFYKSFDRFTYETSRQEIYFTYCD